MKIKLYLFLVVLLLSFFAATAQSSFLDRIDIQSSSLSQILATPEGGFLVAHSYKLKPNDFLFKGIGLIEYDECGNIAWGKKITVEDQYLDIVELLKTKDGYYYLVGYFFDELSERDFFVMKLNPDKSLNFFRVYGTSRKEYPYSMGETPTGDLMIFGMYQSNAVDRRNFFLILDDLGNIKSSKAYFKGGIWGRGLACEDGGYLGRIARTIYKVDSAGNLVWANRYHGINASSEPIEVADGYVAISFRQGQNDTPHFLYKLDKNNGDIIWLSKGYQGRDHAMLKELNNGNLLCMDINYDQQNAPENYISLREFDANGIQLSNRTLMTTYGIQSAWGIDISLTDDDALVFSCFSGTNKDSLFVGKTNLSFELGCEDRIHPIEDTIITMSYEARSTDVIEAVFEVFEVNPTIEVMDVDRTRICETMNSEFPDLPQDTSLCFGESLNLDVFLPGANYIWQDGSTNAFFLAKETGSYTVRIEKCGDWVERDIEVLVEDCPCSIEAPNVFTPNGDGINDSFKLMTDCSLTGFQLDIYNRWGQIVFSTNDYTLGWDGTYQGKLAPAEVYVYRCRYELSDIANTKKETKYGDLSLIR